jgi:hypothetical protein
LVRGKKTRQMWPTPTAITNSGGAAMCKWGGAGARKTMRETLPPEDMNGAPFMSSGGSVSRMVFLAPAPPHLHIAAPPLFVIAVGVGHIWRVFLPRTNSRRTCSSRQACRRSIRRDDDYA